MPGLEAALNRQFNCTGGSHIALPVEGRMSLARIRAFPGPNVPPNPGCEHRAVPLRIASNLFTLDMRDPPQEGQAWGETSGVLSGPKQGGGSCQRT